MSTTTKSVHEIHSKGMSYRALITGKSPLRALYYRWQAVKAEHRALMDEDGSEAEQAVFNEMLRLEQEAADFDPLTMEDLAFKIIFADDDGDMDGSPHQGALAAQAYAMVGIVPRLQERGCGMSEQHESFTRLSDEEAEFLVLYRRQDDVGKEILLAATEAVAEGLVAAETIGERASALFRRRDAGEKLTRAAVESFIRAPELPQGGVA